MAHSMCLVTGTVLLISWMTSLTEACKFGGDWRRQSIGERLNEADLVVYARAVSFNNDSAASGGQPGYHILNVDVQCVMKNTANRTIPGTLSVGQSDPVIVCLEHLFDVKVGGAYLIMLLPPQAGVFGGAYRFAEYNSQLGIETVEINTLMDRCDFVDASLPSSPPAGATCPAVDASGPCAGVACRFGSSPTTIVALMVIWSMTFYHIA